MLVVSFITVVLFHPWADDPAREPAFEGGVVRAGCRRGWITVAVPTDAQPTQFDWGGFGRGHARRFG